MAGWTYKPDTPPGPTDDVRPDQQEWAKWLEKKLKALWNIVYEGKEPEDYAVSIEMEEDGVFILAVGGEDPGGWEATAGKRDGTITIGPVEREVDFTKYKRKYPSVKLQRHQKMIIRWTVTIGSWTWRLYEGLAFWSDLSFHGGTWTSIFWVPVGKPYTVSNKYAYRWRVTSDRRQAGGELADIGLKGDFGEFDENPPDDKPPEGLPGDFSPTHENPFPDTPDLTPPGEEPLKNMIDDFKNITPSELSIGMREYTAKMEGTETELPKPDDILKIPVQSKEDLENLTSGDFWNITDRILIKHGRAPASVRRPKFYITKEELKEVLSSDK